MIDIPKKPSEGKKDTFSFRAPVDLIARFDKVAKGKGYNRTELIVYLIRQAVESDKG